MIAVPIQNRYDPRVSDLLSREQLEHRSLHRAVLGWAAWLVLLAAIFAPVVYWQGAQPQAERPALAPSAVIDGVVARSIGTFESDLRNVVLNVRAEPDDAPMAVWLADDGRMRLDRPGIGSETLTADSGFAWSGKTDSRTLTAERRKELEALRANCRAVLCLPLLGASNAERTGRDSLQFATADETAGEQLWTLRHDEDGNLLSLAAPSAGRVDFIEFKPPPGMSLAQVVDLSGLAAEFCGQRLFELSSAASFFDASTFLPPDRREGIALPPDVDVQPADLPHDPRFETAEARRWLVLDDPGSWQQRVALCYAEGERLGEHDQAGFGDPMLIQPDRLAIPFLPFEDAAPYEAATNETVREVREHTVAAVLAKPGDSFDARVAAAKARLLSFLASQGRKASGPLRIAVNVFYLPELGKDPELPRTMEVRLELPVAD